MIKQRFVVIKAIDKYGNIQRELLVVGGRLSPFLGNTWTTSCSSASTNSLMTYGQSMFMSVKRWKAFAKSEGACRFQKVIYFN